MPEPIAIELREVTKLYRRSHLGRVTITPGVENLSMVVREGEIFGLLGLNGAGKTTTIKLLLGLLFPTLGSVSLFGNTLPNRQVLRRVGYLPELPSFYKYLTIDELLSLYASLSGMERKTFVQRATQVIEEVGLSAQRKKRLGEYSKGMLQRAGLAQALLHDPDLFIFDEPVSGLDPLGLKDMRGLLEKLHGAGKTIVFSSHIISEAEKLCDRVGIIHRGRLSRTLQREEWQKGGLESLFLETIHG